MYRKIYRLHVEKWIRSTAFTTVCKESVNLYLKYQNKPEFAVKSTFKRPALHYSAKERKEHRNGLLFRFSVRHAEDMQKAPISPADIYVRIHHSDSSCILGAGGDESTFHPQLHKRREYRTTTIPVADY
uniref:Uncharacterized protein n=1 Tax=Glossina pallidipes TaxID=7398 RepID=A0A1A9ZQD0_GLOPL